MINEMETRQPTLTLSKAALTSSAEAVGDRTVVGGEIHVVAHGSSVLSTIGHLVGGLLHLRECMCLWERRLARVGRTVALSHMEARIGAQALKRRVSSLLDTMRGVRCVLCVVEKRKAAATKEEQSRTNPEIQRFL